MDNVFDLISLNDLAPHHFGVIRDVEAGELEVERLKAMGLCEGRTVEVVMRGDPLIVKVLGTRIGISRRLGSLVQVELCHAQDA